MFTSAVETCASLSPLLCVCVCVCVCVCKIQVKKPIITPKPHTLLSLFWFDSGCFGCNLSWSFPARKREKRDHLSTLWQKILQENNKPMDHWVNTPPSRHMLWYEAQNSGPGHKSAKQCHKNLLHFDLSQKAEKRFTESSCYNMLLLVWCCMIYMVCDMH